MLSKITQFVIVFVAVFGFVALPVFGSVVEPDTARMNLISVELSEDIGAGVNPTIFIDRAYLSATYFDSSPLWVDGVIGTVSNTDEECELSPLDDHTCSAFGAGYSAPWGEVEAVSDIMELGFDYTIVPDTTYYFRILVWDNDFDTALHSDEFSFILNSYAPVPLSEELQVGIITQFLGVMSNLLYSSLKVMFALMALLVGIFVVWRILVKAFGAFYLK